MSFAVQFRAIAEQLDKDMVLSLVLADTTDITRFKARLSQAKFHAGIEGKLDYTCVHNPAEKTYTLTIVLQPAPAKTVQVLAINTKGGL